MAKPKIVLVRRGNTDTYKVKQTVDNMRVKVGDCLNESEVEDIQDSRKYTVVCQAAFAFGVESEK